MTISRFQNIVNELKSRFLPDGRIELFESGDIDQKRFIFTSNNTTQAIIETAEKVVVTIKITPELFVEVSANKANYNIGIMKRVAKEISEEIRKNAIMTTQ